MSAQPPGSTSGSGTCSLCEGAGYAPTRFGRQLCHACRGTGTAAPGSQQAAAPSPDRPSTAEMEQLIVEIDQLLNRYRDGRQADEIAAVERKCKDFIEKTRLAIDSGMPEMFAPLVSAFERIRDLDGR